MGNTSTSASSVSSQRKSTAGVRNADTSAEYGSLPTLLSSNRNAQRQREMAKAWHAEQEKIAEAMGSGASLRARVYVSNTRLAAYGDNQSTTSINEKAKKSKR